MSKPIKVDITSDIVSAFSNAYQNNVGDYFDNKLKEAAKQYDREYMVKLLYTYNPYAAELMILDLPKNNTLEEYAEYLDKWISLAEELGGDGYLFIEFIKTGNSVNIFDKPEYKNIPKSWVLALLGVK